MLQPKWLWKACGFEKIFVFLIEDTNNNRIHFVLPKILFEHRPPEIIRLFCQIADHLWMFSWLVFFHCQLLGRGLYDLQLNGALTSQNIVEVSQKLFPFWKPDVAYFFSNIDTFSRPHYLWNSSWLSTPTKQCRCNVNWKNIYIP